MTTENNVLIKTRKTIAGDLIAALVQELRMPQIGIKVGFDEQQHILERIKKRAPHPPDL